jgi:hypothetical protein
MIFAQENPSTRKCKPRPTVNHTIQAINGGVRDFLANPNVVLEPPDTSFSISSEVNAIIKVP